MVVVRSLGSGSSGNALLIEAGDAAIAVDCGVGIRTLTAGLRASGRRLSDLAAVLLTHEHGDHVRSLPQVVRAGVRLIATAGTARAGGLPRSLWEEACLGARLRVGQMEVTALAVSHDAAEPCGYYLRVGETGLTVVTDLGRADDALHDYLAASDLIVIEANHDEGMVRGGPYPAHLKRRILSPRGHLSNADCGRLLAAAIGRSNRPRTIWLAHLSLINNRPALARQTVECALVERGVVVPVIVLPRREHPGEWRPGAGTTVAVQLALPFSSRTTG